MIINIYVTSMWERFLYIFLAGFGIFIFQKLTAKLYDRAAFNSKRSALHSLLMIVIRSLIFTTGAVFLVAWFLGNGDEFSMLVDNVLWINMNYLVRYLIVYAVIYGLAYMTTSLVLVNV